MSKISNETANKRVLLTFLIGLAVTQLAFLVSQYISQGYAFNTILHNSQFLSYNDFYEPITFLKYENPYEAGYAYPPLCIFIFKILSNLMPTNITNSIYDTDYFNHFTDVTLGVIVFVAFFALISAIVMYESKKGSPIVKTATTLLLLFSTPFLFLYERANITILTVPFIAFFLLYYDDERLYIRELSYVALAFATAIKIYPALLGLLILKNKKYKEALHCVVYGVVLFFVPFLFCGGFHSVGLLVKNIFGSTASYYDANGVAYRIDLFSDINIISLSLGNGYIKSNIIKYVTWGVLCAGLLAYTFISKSKWRSVLSITLLSIVAPSFSSQYSLVYLIVPIILFLDSEEKRTWSDYSFLAMFLVILSPIAIENCILSFDENGFYEVFLYSYLCSVAVFIMVLLLVIEAITYPFKDIDIEAKNREQRLAAKEKAKEKAKEAAKQEKASSQTSGDTETLTSAFEEED